MYKCASDIQVVIRGLPYLFHEEEEIGSKRSEVVPKGKASVRNINDNLDYVHVEP